MTNDTNTTVHTHFLWPLIKAYLWYLGMCNRHMLLLRNFHHNWIRNCSSKKPTPNAVIAASPKSKGIAHQRTRLIVPSDLYGMLSYYPKPS